MADLVRAKAKRDFPFAEDGIHIRDVKTDDVLDLPEDIYTGLEADGLVTKVSDNAKLTAPAKPVSDEPIKPEIEPVEHGGHTVDRVLTQGINADAVAVEDADAVATHGKTTARAEITGATPEEEAAKAADKAADEAKAVGAAPENKSTRAAKKS